MKFYYLIVHSLSPANCMTVSLLSYLIYLGSVHRRAETKKQR